MENDKAKKKSLDLQTKPEKQSSKLFLIALVLVAIIIIAALVYVFLGSKDTILDETRDLKKEWYFKGAFANYHGSTTYLFISVDFSMRLEIVDFNSTHIKALYDMKLQSNSLGTLFSEQETKWVSTENFGIIAMQEMEGYILDEIYQDNFYFEGLGTRICDVYKFIQKDSESGNVIITIYVDLEIKWPIKMSLGFENEQQSIFFDINLTETNIHELI